MTASLYGKGREGFLDGSIDWDTDNIKAILVDTADYVVSIDVHDNIDDVAVAARVVTIANAPALASKTVTLGVADAADVTFTAVTGDSVEAIILFKDTGVESSSRLIAYIDSASATGLPVTPNGGDISIAWDNGGNKIFKL